MWCTNVVLMRIYVGNLQTDIAGAGAGARNAWIDGRINVDLKGRPIGVLEAEHKAELNRNKPRMPRCCGCGTAAGKSRAHGGAAGRVNAANVRPTKSWNRRRRPLARRPLK